MITAATILAFQALTPRQQKIARLYAEGGTYEDVATTMQIAPSTVKNHLSLIYNRLFWPHAGHGMSLAYLIGFMDGVDSVVSR